MPGTSNEKTKSRDILPRSLREVPIVGSDVVSADETAFFWAEDKVITAIEWYLRRKRGQSRWSKSLRVLAIVAGTAGGLAPLIHAAKPSILPSEWGYVFLAAAAACLLADRLFGFSASWMRFMSAQALLQIELTEAQQKLLAWRAASVRGPEESQTSNLDGPEPIASRLSLASAQIIWSETVEWKDDLSKQLASVDARWDKRQPSAKQT